MHPDIVYECFSCKFSFDSYKELSQHIIIGHNNTSSVKRYLCECGKSFHAKYRLIDHQLCHTDEKIFKCTHQNCQKAFKRKPELRDHLKTHEGKLGKQIVHKYVHSFFEFLSIFFLCIFFSCQHAEYICECGEGFVLPRQLRNHKSLLEITSFAYLLSAVV